MAKHQPEPSEPKPFFKRVSFWQKVVWGIVLLICVLFGYSYGYPIVAKGELVRGILIGVAYGAGALIAIMISYFLNQKLRGH